MGGASAVFFFLYLKIRPLSPRRRRGWGGSVSVIPLLRRRQNRKIFFSLIEKIFAGARLKKCLENFSVLLGESKADAVRKHWAGLPPAGRQSKASIGILFKIGSNFIQKTPSFFINLVESL